MAIPKLFYMNCLLLILLGKRMEFLSNLMGSFLVAPQSVKINGIETVTDKNSSAQAGAQAKPLAMPPVADTLFERKPWLLKPVPDSESVPSNFEITWVDLTPEKK
jgi:hypothetical protein